MRRTPQLADGGLVLHDQHMTRHAAGREREAHLRSELRGAGVTVLARQFGRIDVGLMAERKRLLGRDTDPDRQEEARGSDPTRPDHFI
jgi:hypothetical protein